jgi:RAP domain
VVVQIVVEVDGPSHFSVNSHRPLGRTVARRCMLEGHGYIVRSIPFYEWNALDGKEQHKAYVTRLLASAFAYM